MYTLVWFHRLLNGRTRLWWTHWSTWSHSSRACSWLPSYITQIRFDFDSLLRLWLRIASSHLIDLLQRQIISSDCTHMSYRTIILIWKIFAFKLRLLRFSNKLHRIILSCISHVFGSSLYFLSVFANIFLSGWSLVAMEHLAFLSGVIRHTSATRSLLVFEKAVARVVSAYI